MSRQHSGGLIRVKARTPELNDIWSMNEAVVNVDARGLEPPQPMVVILETLSELPERAELRVHTDRRPLHLYPLLEQRGFSGETEEQHDGSFITIIRRA